MSKSINLRLSQLTFPKTCVVCHSPASKEYGLEATFTYGRRSHIVKVRVPMCDSHFEAASYKSPAERLVNWAAVFGGALFGLICATLLVLRWQTDENILFKLLGGGIFGLGAFAIVWWIVTASIAPLFAASQSKEARNAVRITHYWPAEKVVQLKFENDSLA